MQESNKTSGMGLLLLTLVLFSPDDRPTEHLIRQIDNAKTRIYAAVYMFTDKKIAKALLSAHKNRGVDVQLVVDRSSVDSSFGKAKIVSNGGIPTFVFKTSAKRSHMGGALMHNKFAIIDNKLWTGSFNWTISANKRNQENVILTDEKNVREAYLNHFEKLKKRCIQLGSAEKEDLLQESCGIQETFIWLWAKIKSWLLL